MADLLLNNFVEKGNETTEANEKSTSDVAASHVQTTAAAAAAAMGLTPF